MFIWVNSIKTWLASWPEWLYVKTYWVFKCKRQQDKKDHVSIYLYIILCLKVVGTILQIERIEPFKEWMIQSKCDVCSISYGCCQFPWKWKMKRSSLLPHTRTYLAFKFSLPTRSLCGPLSTEFQFHDTFDLQFVQPSWCLLVRTTYLRKRLNKIMYSLDLPNWPLRQTIDLADIEG